MTVDEQNERAVTWFNQGVELAKKGAYDDAVFCFDKALGITPRDINILNTKGLALQGLGKFNEALECYDNVLVIDPQNINALTDIGQVCHRLGKYREALACYDRSLAVKSDVFETWYNKALALVNLNRLPDALKALEQALKLDPHHIKAQKLKEILTKRTGR
ncbi:MAG: tetratricopeptide repeat protein [bacterium]|nr:tetratricopeptide repeat protein [bacterium]